MTQQRRRGSRIGPRLRAEIAIDIADGVPKADIVRTRRVGRESVRLLLANEEFARSVTLARRRLASGVPRARILEALTEASSSALEFEPPSPEEAWASLESAVGYLASLCLSWNAGRLEGTHHPLETDLNRIVELVAAHVGEASPGPGCQKLGEMLKSILDACVAIPAYDARGLLGTTDLAREAFHKDAFVPWQKEFTAT